MAAITVMTSNSMRAVMAELAPAFERASGHQVTVAYDPAKLILERIAAGETPDLLICGGPALEGLARQGKVRPASIRAIHSCGSGVAVSAGVPKPDIGSVEAFKRALLAAKSVAYTQDGASGIHFSGLIQRLGIAREIEAKAVRQPGGLVGELVAAGKAEMAIQQIPELMAVPGIQFVGPLPPEVQLVTASSAAVFATTPHAEAAQAFLDFLASPASARVFKAKGLEPATRQ